MKASEIKTLLAKLVRRPVDQLRDDLMLRDLIADSFDMIELVIELQEETGVRLSQEDLRTLDTVADVIRFFTREPDRQELGTS